MAKAGFSEAFVVAGEYNVSPPAPVSGQSVPLQLDSNGNLLVNIGSSITVSENLASVGGAAISLGAKTSALSLPVVLATDEAALPVTLTSTTVTNVVSDNLTQVGGSAVTLGAKTSAASIPVVLASDEANVPVLGAAGARSTTTWNSTTPGSSSISVNCRGYSTVAVIITNTGGTFTAGQVRFLATITGSSNLMDINGMRIGSLTGALPRTQNYDAQSFHTFTSSEAWIYWFPVSGFDVFDVILTTAITGTGASEITVQASNEPMPGPTTVGQSDASKLNATVTLSAASSSTVAATWNSSTPNNTSIDLFPTAGQSVVGVNIHTDGGTFTAGVLQFFGNSQGGNAGIGLTGMRHGVFLDQLYDAKNSHTLASGSDWTYWFPIGAITKFSVFISTAITGSGNVTVTLRSFNGVMPGPTTVGQSDPTKLNATVDSVVNTSAPSFSNATTNPLQADAAGNLRINPYGSVGSFTTKINTSSSGNNATLTVPAGKKWIVKSGYLKVVTGATVGNRNMTLAALDASATLFTQTFAMASSTTLVNQPASTTVFYFFSPVYSFYQTATIVVTGSNTFLLSFPEVVLGPSFTLQSFIMGLVAGDSAQLFVNVIELPD